MSVEKDVYKYLRDQNRPFSVNDIVSKIETTYSKPQVQKALDKLVSTEKIFEKVYGKQKIYCAKQDSAEDATELIRINRERQAHSNEVESKLQEVEKEVREYEAKLRTLRSNPSLKDALKTRDEFKLSVTELSEKLEALVKASEKEEPEVPEKKKKGDKKGEKPGGKRTNVRDQLKEYTREYGKRKRLCTDIIDTILENYSGTKKELYEKIGIEVKIVQC